MSIVLVRKPPVGKKFDSLRIVLEGNHTLKQKLCMVAQAKFLLQHEHNIHFAGDTNLYMPLVDKNGYPLTHFPNGDEIAEFIMRINSPYHCAADSYDSLRTSPSFQS